MTTLRNATMQYLALFPPRLPLMMDLMNIEVFNA